MHSARKNNRKRISISTLVTALIAGLALLLHGSVALGAKRLPSYLGRSGPMKFEDVLGDGGPGGTYECENEMAELIELMGDAWNDLPEEAIDDLMRELNRKYPCEGGGWGWLGDLGDFIKDLPGDVKDFGECVYEIVSDIDDFDYDTLLDAFYENGDSCYWKDKERLDCSVREERAADPGWRCVPASRFNGSCISSAEIADVLASSGLDRCLELDGDAEFCEDETTPFDVTVYLTTSDVELDCNDRTITGMPGGPGIRTPYERSVSDIRIRSCHIQDTDRYGIDLKRYFRGAELDGEMQGHRDISVEDTSIENPGQIGVYVGQNSRNVSFHDLEILGAKVAGIYLEAGSTDTLVSGGAIRDTQPKSGRADPGAAIAIDSSQHNTIEGVTFEGNSGGDIKLYKNCGENYGQVCPIRRPLSASHNVIRFNEFNDDVSVASRQFKLNGPGWCAGIDLVGFWRDRASDNLIYANRFQDAKLDLQDGPNDVCGNEFIGGELELGVHQPGGVIDQPVEIDGIIGENTFDATSVVDVRALDVFDDLDFFGNRDVNGTCLAMADVCAPAESPDTLEQLPYVECVTLDNECNARTTSSMEAAAQACDVWMPPVTTPWAGGGELEVAPSADPAPLPGAQSTVTRSDLSPSRPLASPRLKPTVLSPAATPKSAVSIWTPMPRR